MTRTAYDGVDWQRNPATANDIALLYLDGAYAAPAEAADHFHALGAQAVRITVLGDPGAGICDVETGDVTPAAARNYIRARRATGHAATIYVSLASLGAVRNACMGLVYDTLAADWTGLPHEVPGCVGCQYLPGPDYDTSVIWDEGWHRRAAG
jgi:hypothetical protein